MRQNRLNFSGKRTTGVLVKLSLEEVEALETAMVRLGMRKRAEFLRFAAMNLAGSPELAPRSSAAYRRAPRARVRAEILEAET